MKKETSRFIIIVFRLLIVLVCIFVGAVHILKIHKYASYQEMLNTTPNESEVIADTQNLLMADKAKIIMQDRQEDKIYYYIEVPSYRGGGYYQMYVVLYSIKSMGSYCEWAYENNRYVYEYQR